jgi:hypothetical protein
MLDENTTECKTNPEKLEGPRSAKSSADAFGKKFTVNSSLSPLISSDIVKFPLEFSKFFLSNLAEKKTKADPQTPIRQSCTI